MARVLSDKYVIIIQVDGATKRIIAEGKGSDATATNDWDKGPVDIRVEEVYVGTNTLDATDAACKASLKAKGNIP